MTLVRHMLYAQSSDTSATLQEQAKFSKCKKKRRNRFPQELIFAFRFLDPEASCAIAVFTTYVWLQKPWLPIAPSYQLTTAIKAASSACARGEHVSPDLSLGRQRV